MHAKHKKNHVNTITNLEKKKKNSSSEGLKKGKKDVVGLSCGEQSNNSSKA